MPLPDWVSAAETKAAPGPLLVVQAFVNTRDAGTGVDLLDRADTAWEWLVRAGLLKEAAVGPDPVAVRGIREALRGLIDANAGHQAASRDRLSGLATIARQGRLQISLGADGRLSIAPDRSCDALDALTLRLLLVVRDAQSNGTWWRLKTCSNPACRWAYYDRSHSRRGRWCDMATCGNRLKNRTLRARRRRSS